MFNATEAECKVLLQVRIKDVLSVDHLQQLN